MKKIIIALVLITILLICMSVAYVVGTKQQINDSITEMPAGKAEKKVLYWHDPMVPGHKFDQPGKSPFMDMMLVPVYEDESNNENQGISVSPRIQQNLGIRLAEVKRETFTSTLTAVGIVNYNEQEQVILQARANGYIEKLHVRATLDSVQQGQPLMDMVVPEWLAAQQDYLTLTHLSAQDKILINAAVKRMQQIGMTLAQINLLKKTSRAQPIFTLTSPIKGTVVELLIREGMTIMPGTPLLRINATNTMWLLAEIPENLLAQVSVGTEIDAQSAAFPNHLFHGKVQNILPQVDAITRTIKVRIELDNAEGLLTAGTFVNVTLKNTTAKPVLTIPTEAIIQTGKRTLVMLSQEEGRFVPTIVEAGRENNGSTEILQGLTMGQKVVVSGQFLLDSEASLKGLTP